MIIVSQNRKAIINFDNVNELFIDADGRVLLFDNTYRAGDDYSDKLGIYKTEERAKEVLQEIIERYINWEKFKAGQPEGICSPKYEMPEE